MTEPELIQRIQEAYDVQRRAYDPVGPSRRMGYWPTPLREFADLVGQPAKSVLGPPHPAAIDRAQEVLEWFASHLQLHPIGAKIIWLTHGRGLSLDQAQIAMRKGRRVTREAVRLRRKAAMSALLDGINRNISRAA